MLGAPAERLAVLSSHLTASSSSSSATKPTDTFHGHICNAPFDPPTSSLTWGPFNPKTFGSYDIDIAITHCGICGSDLHTLRQGWGGTKYPVVVGHEIIGHAVKIGNQVPSLPFPIRLGDRIGVGAQAFSCHKPTCNECSSHRQNHCRFSVDTYNGTYPDGSGRSYGGYADYVRVDGRFCFRIPDALPSEVAAPLLCAGVTVYSPLKQLGAGPGKTIAIIGVGGLGHIGIMLAKAMGCDKVIALSRGEGKREDALRLGAHEYYSTSPETSEIKKKAGDGIVKKKQHYSKALARQVDGIVCTVSSSKMPLREYLRLLKVSGRFIMVGAPDGGEMPPVNVFQLIGSNISVGGSAIGSPDEVRECLQFCAEKNVKPWIKTWKMKDAEQAVQEMEDGKAKYRFVLEN